MQKQKKIISFLIKLLIGIGSFFIIYLRLKNDLSPEKINLLLNNVFSVYGGICLIVCLLLLPINWGIESYKWQLITGPVETISFKTASQSVYSGICLGNLAPGRATEFLAKIIFFKLENRPKITALHFINGMFQLCITYSIGLIALSIQFKQFNNANNWVAYTTTLISLLIFVVFTFCIVKINFVLTFITKKLSKQKQIDEFEYSFTTKKLVQLFGLSLIRYIVFSLQFVLLIYLFHQHTFNFSIFIAIAIYFLITTTIPMISVLEAPIRAAIALMVFQNTAISPGALALSSILIWFINIIIPSVFGYIILLKQNFDFKLFNKKT